RQPTSGLLRRTPLLRGCSRYRRRSISKEQLSASGFQLPGWGRSLGTVTLADSWKLVTGSLDRKGPVLDKGGSFFVRGCRSRVTIAGDSVVLASYSGKGLELVDKQPAVRAGRGRRCPRSPRCGRRCFGPSPSEQRPASQRGAEGRGAARANAERAGSR